MFTEYMNKFFVFSSCTLALRVGFVVCLVFLLLYILGKNWFAHQQIFPGNPCRTIGENSDYFISDISLLTSSRSDPS